MLVAAALAAARWPLFKVKSIDCRLNQYPCPPDLEPVLVPLIGQNIFSLNPAAVTRQLAAFDPTLTGTDIRKILPARLKIGLVRRQPVGRVKLQPSGEEFYVDKSGFVYRLPAGSAADGVEVLWPDSIPLTEGQTVLSQNLAQLLNTLSVYFVGVSQVIRQSEAVYLIKTASGPEALLRADGELAPAVGSLQYILTNLKIGEPVPKTIDLRFDKPILIY